MRSIAKQVVILTGASAGIGETTARWLARQGAFLVLAARRGDRLEKLRSELESVSSEAPAQRSLPQIHLVPADVTLPADRRRIVDETLARFGRIDALINNAGYGQRGPIEILPLEAIRANFEVNFFGLIGLTQLVIPVMRRQGAGRIINVSSVAGKIARPYSSVYDSTKHALEAISDGLRGELAPFGIQVVLIEPGLIITEFMDVADQVSLPHLRESGPYASILEESRKNQHRGRSIAAPADVIANLILKGLSDSRPRLRYVAPLHAKIFLALKWFLPGRTFDFLLNRILNPTPPKPSL